jgi:hypothetical protein
MTEDSEPNGSKHSLNLVLFPYSINQLIFVMEKCCVFLEAVQCRGNE